MEYMWGHLTVGVYLIMSLAIMVAAVVNARRAHRTGDLPTLRRAGTLAILGGLQHATLVGLPAIWACVSAIRGANRAEQRTSPSVWQQVRPLGVELNIFAALVILTGTASSLAEGPVGHILSMFAGVIMPALVLFYAVASRHILRTVLVGAFAQILPIAGFSLIHAYFAPDAAAFLIIVVASTCAFGAFAAWIARKMGAKSHEEKEDTYA